MALHSLLFTRDQEVVTLVGEVLQSLEIEVSHCADAQSAIARLAETRFDAILVDNSDVRGAVALLSAAKSLAACEQTVGIVLATSRTSIGLADGARSHMVLYRPLSADRLRNGIKSALKLRGDGEDAREFHRAAIHIPATLRGSGLDETLVFISNLSPGGAALNLGHSIPISSVQAIEFALPDTTENLKSAVELVWRDVEGRVGLRFTNMSTDFSENLEKWLESHPALPNASKASA